VLDPAGCESADEDDALTFGIAELPHPVTERDLGRIVRYARREYANARGAAFDPEGDTAPAAAPGAEATAGSGSASAV